MQLESKINGLAVIVTILMESSDDRLSINVFKKHNKEFLLSLTDYKHNLNKYFDTPIF